MSIGRCYKSETIFQVSVPGRGAQYSLRGHVLCYWDRVGKTEGLLLAVNCFVCSGLFVKTLRGAVMLRLAKESGSPVPLANVFLSPSHLRTCCKTSISHNLECPCGHQLWKYEFLVTSDLAATLALLLQTCFPPCNLYQLN